MNGREPAGGSPVSGHRTVPHTADVGVEAWSPTLEGCIAEAVRAMVDGFADTSAAGVSEVREHLVVADSDEDLLARVLEEAVYRMDTDDEIPLETVVDQVRGEEGRRTARVRFRMTRTGSVVPVGAVPKAVSLHGLRLSGGPDGWTCRVTLDV